MISLTKLSKPFYEADKFWQNKVSDHVEILGTLTSLFQIAWKLLKRSYKPVLIYVYVKVSWCKKQAKHSISESYKLKRWVIWAPDTWQQRYV